MKLKRSKKIILTVIMIAVMLFAFSNTTVFGAINNGYSGVDSVTDTALDSAFEDSSLLGLLARLIYAVGRFLEWILGTIFKMLTGITDYPWADKIVFNAVPLLDVNFINPAAGSFVGNTNIQGVLKNMYSTILSLAVSFFGIVVLITAIKLVISTIASDKAKYKQAIIDWAVGFVMLFCMHYFISFVFYLNEELVKVASSIVKQQLDQAEANNAPIVQAQTAAVSGELIDNIERKLDGTSYESKVSVLTNNMGVVQAWLNLDSGEDSKGAHEYYMKNSSGLSFDINMMSKNEYIQLIELVEWVVSDSVSMDELKNIRSRIRLYKERGTNRYAQAMLVSDFRKLPTHNNQGGQRFEDLQVKYQLAPCTDNDKMYCISGSGKNHYITKGSERLGGYKDVNSAENSFYFTDLVDDLIRIKSARSDGGSSSNATGVRLISDLASYFRYNSYSAELRTLSNTGVKSTGNIQIQNMIMYAILVAQSLILFISYIKRLFYVVMLAMLAPIVVVVDFFQKFGK